MRIAKTIQHNENGLSMQAHHQGLGLGITTLKIILINNSDTHSRICLEGLSSFIFLSLIFMLRLKAQCATACFITSSTFFSNKAPKTLRKLITKSLWDFSVQLISSKIYIGAAWFLHKSGVPIYPEDTHQKKSDNRVFLISLGVILHTRVFSSQSSLVHFLTSLSILFNSSRKLSPLNCCL